MKQDEREMLDFLKDKKLPDLDVINSIGIPIKRVTYILSKWSGKGWWDYGVNVVLGWLTEKGKES